MKKARRKLVLDRQIVRVLAPMDLGRAVVGADSGDVRCPALVDSGDKLCSTEAAAVATVACG